MDVMTLAGDVSDMSGASTVIIDSTRLVFYACCYPDPYLYGPVPVVVVRYAYMPGVGFSSPLRCGKYDSLSAARAAAIGVRDSGAQWAACAGYMEE